MFIGHNAVGFASKRLAPRTSLGWLMAAPMLLDLLWPVFLLLDLEHVRITPNPENPFLNFEFTDYPWSHSLLMAIAWGIVFGAIYFWRSGNARGALVLALGVVSHWVLDFVTHVPDLPLYPGGPKVGLGLWNSPILNILIEMLLFAAGIAIYMETTRAKDRIGSMALWLLAGLLIGLYLGLSHAKPPQSVQQLAIVGLSGWLFPIWAAWIDRHRESAA